LSRNIVIFFLFLLLSVTLSLRKHCSDNVVNVYGWYGIISREILNEFEKETGIKVVYDVYDNNDTLEAKLLATNSGYDVIFPSFIPYAARQQKIGVYSKLDKNLIPNADNINGIITKKYIETGGDLNYLLPIFWGTTGIAYEESTISSVFPDEEIDSYDILFDPKKIAKIAKYGVSFPEEYIDIFPQIGAFLEIEQHKNIMDIRKYLGFFKKIRRHIKKFSSSTMIHDLISGEVVIAIGSSDNAWRAIKSGKNVGKNIKYIIPRNYGVIWIDCVGIPQKAPHKKNAHKFLEYILRPEIAARITNSSGILVNVDAAAQFLHKEITENKQIYPIDQNLLKSLLIGSPNKNTNEMQYDKIATRTWSQIKMNEFILMNKTEVTA
jgi:putrescine transport system substrate-binding protein